VGHRIAACFALLLSRVCAHRVLAEGCEAMGKMNIAVAFATIGLLIGRAQAETIKLSHDVRTAVEKVLDEQIDLLNRGAPVDIAPNQKLLKAERNAETITYTVEVPFEGKPAPMPKAVHKLIVDYIVKHDCTTEDVRFMLNVGYSVRHVFVDQNGYFADNVLVTEQSCVSANLEATSSSQDPKVRCWVNEPGPWCDYR
jgi:hypothetical protein